MSEVWLKQNVRVTAFVTVLLAIAAGVILGIACWGISPTNTAIRAGLLVVAGLALALLAAVCLVGWRSRLAYSQGRLHVNLRLGSPYRVPIEFVEAFLLGQSPAMLPGKSHERTETRSLSIKLADRATEWQHQDTWPAWGKWCGGYIIIRGTWCEPLSLAVVNRLNQRLSEVQREHQAAQAPSVPLGKHA
jgi:hypothetical protein